MDLQGKKILFFTAVFQGFQNDIKQALESLGAEVDFFDERVSSSTISKAIIRINRNYLSVKINKYYEKIISNIRKNHYDFVFFINIEAASKKIIEKLKYSQPKAKFILYEWDSIRNNNHAKGMLEAFDVVWSFDKEDCKKLNLNFLPLFYNTEYTKIKKPSLFYKYDFCFVGTIHSDRYKIVRNICDQAKVDGYNCFCWYYFPSKLLFYKMWFSDPRFRQIANPKDFQYKSLSKHQLVNIVEQSNIIIDVQHPNQTGLTMRTIESVGAQRKLITTNAHIREYDFYNPNNILIIDRNNPIVPNSFVETPYQELPTEIYTKYSLKSWLKTIFA